MSQPISLHPVNPHYFLYCNKPVILVSSAEHYGAVINKAFDFKAYLEELKECGNNLVRIFTGVQREAPGVFYGDYNTLAPAAEEFLCPYKRTGITGANDGLNKFDLDEWEDAFFKRLCEFIDEAALRKIIVELTFFCPYYRQALGDATWNLSPYHPENNINGVGAAGCDALFTLEDEVFARYQLKLVSKLAQLLNPYDNLMYEIMNEPYMCNATEAFQAAVARTIVDTEALLPQKHLITQNISNGYSRIMNPDPNVSVFNFHYASPPRAVEVNYGIMKPIGCNETGFMTNNLDLTYRSQAWEFFLAGGALFNNLDFSFSAGNERGEGISRCEHTGGSHNLRLQFGFLRRFMDGLDFIGMHPANDLIHSIEAINCNGYLMAESGRQYAFYIADGSISKASLIAEPGKYLCEMFNPANGNCIASKNIDHEGGVLLLNIENKEKIEDIAIRLTAEAHYKSGNCNAMDMNPGLL